MEDAKTNDENIIEDIDPASEYEKLNDIYIAGDTDACT